MAFKLTKKQVAERNELATDLRIKASRLAVAITNYNETMATVAQSLQGAIEPYEALVHGSDDEEALPLPMLQSVGAN